MYGDNQNLFLGAIGLILILLLGSLSVVSLVKIHKLEDVLDRSDISVSDDPGKDSAGADKGGPERGAIGEDGDDLFYRALDLWEQKETSREAARAIGNDLREQDWAFLEDLDLTLTESSSLYTWTLNRALPAETEPLFYLEFEGREWVLRTPGGESFSFARLSGRVERFIREQTELYDKQQEERERCLRLFEELQADRDILRLAERKHCRLKGPEEDRLGITVLTAGDGRPVVTALWNGASLVLDGEIFTGSDAEFSAAFRNRLSLADTRSDEELRLSAGLDRIRALYGDRKFSSRLERMGLYPDYLEREDADFVYLDLKDETGNLRASFAVKKYTGRLHILDDRGISLASLDSLRTGDIPLPENLADLETPYEDGESFNVLLVGYHNQGTDTMIVAHVNRISEKVSLISIPRDLWWEGQKINSYYFGSGKEDFLAVMTELTGLKIDYYLSVDMYAFIDVVNALGGIDVTLEGEVRDPTYKIVRENGTEGTLYYPPGTYHLNGVEALRLARSRHGSSDFERSLLQQKILSALRARAGELSLRDIGLFKSFLKIASEQTQTNMSLPFMVSRFLKIRDYQWDGGHNLNDETLLYNTYTEYLDLSPAELSAARESGEFYRGQWILLPLGEDWNLIKARVRQIIQG